MPDLTSPAALKARFRARALELGAHALGVSAPAPDPQTQARLLASVERGDLATWGYDAAWARTAADPAAHLPVCASVVSIAVAYAHPKPKMPLGAGRVSAYAWSGEDYHTQVHAILDELARALTEWTGAAGHVAVCDTRPIAERAVAARAGVGWIGKHTNLIVPGAGSYVFLGEMLTTVALPPDEPLKKQCGSCTRCATICPTGALRADYTLDARRCISDLTQRRGMIPREMRPYMGTWIWGCDLCQDICPPTQRATVQAAPIFAPRAAAYPDLIALLSLTNEEFKTNYQATAMGWRGAALLRRNAAIALGNTFDRATVPVLCDRLLTEPSSMVRGHIAWALGRIGSHSATRALENALQAEKNAAVREELHAALATSIPARI